MNWITKQLAKLRDDVVHKTVWWIAKTVGATALAAGIIAWFTDWLSKLWAWSTDEMVTYRIAFLIVGVVAAALAICVGVLMKRLQRVVARIATVEIKQTQLASISATQPAPTANQPFKARVVTDPRLNIEWHILEDPNRWLGAQIAESSSHAMRVIAGPYHSKCKAAFESFQSDDDELQNVISGICPQCLTRVFEWDSPRTLTVNGRAVEISNTERETRYELLKELQRMARNGIDVTANPTVKNPGYRLWMIPPRD
jgi:hypothetical protein